MTYIQWRRSLYVGILCGLLSCIAAPYVRSIGHVFAYLYTLDDDLERPIYYETSLFHNVFPYIIIIIYSYSKNLKTNDTINIYIYAKVVD